MTYDARNIANYLLDLAESSALFLSNMALLKHVYFAHGWHLAGTGRPLIKNRFEAWEHGPVVRCVYDSFKAFGARPISGRAESIDFETGEIKQYREPIAQDSRNIISSTFQYYSALGALELSDLTHERGTPWHDVWHAKGRVTLNMEIPRSAIEGYFLRAELNALRIN